MLKQEHERETYTFRELLAKHRALQRDHALLEASYGDLVDWAQSLYQLAEAHQQQADLLKERSEAWEALYWDAVRPGVPHLTIVRPEVS